MVVYMIATADPKNGILFYSIPENEKLYRGTKYRDTLVGAQHKFFAFTPEEAAQYGSVTEYRAKRELKLVALDQPNDAFFELAAGETAEVEIETKRGTSSRTVTIHSILQRHYGFNNSGPRKRYSDNKYDSAVVDFICRLGFDGYAIVKRMKTDFDGEFHPEVAICFPAEAVRPTIEQPPPPVVSYSAAAVTPPRKGGRSRRRRRSRRRTRRSSSY